MNHRIATAAVLTAAALGPLRLRAGEGDAPATAAPATPAAPVESVRIPVKEITVFKDGHAFVLHEGDVPAAGGSVILDQLPSPVIGTFWSYSADPKARLKSVTAGRRKVRVQQTALILKGDRVLAQGLMTYAPPGGIADLEATAAVNILARKDEGLDRKPGASQGTCR